MKNVEIKSTVMGDLRLFSDKFESFCIIYLVLTTNNISDTIGEDMKLTTLLIILTILTMLTPTASALGVVASCKEMADGDDTTFRECLRQSLNDIIDDRSDIDRHDIDVDIIEDSDL